MPRLHLWVAALGCGGDEANDLPIPDGDADADSDADSDADADPETRLRFLHVAPGVPPQDLLANGSPGDPPLAGLRSWTRTRARPAG